MTDNRTVDPVEWARRRLAASGPDTEDDVFAPAADQPTLNPADMARQIAADQRKQEDAQRTGNAALALTRNPQITTDDAATSAELNRAGLPTTPGVVAGDRERFAAELSRQKAQRELDKAPATASWLSQGDNAAYVRKDVPTLATMEGQFREPGWWWAPVEAGKGVPRGALGATGSAIRGEAIRAAQASRDNLRGVDTVLRGLIENDTPETRQRAALRIRIYATMQARNTLADEPGRQGARSDELSAMAARIEEGGAIADEIATLGIMAQPAAEATRGYQFGDDVQNLLKAYLDPARGTEEWFATQLGEGLGSVLPYLVTHAAAAPSAGASLLAGGGVAALQGMDEAYKRARKHGLAPEEATKFAFQGAIPGAVQVLPFEFIMRKMPSPMRRRALAVVRDIAVAAGVEMIGESIGAIGQNMIEQQYNPAQTTFEGVLGQGLMGGAVGATLRGVLLAAVPGMRRGLYRDIEKNEQSAALEQTFRNLQENAQSTEAWAKVPEQFRAWAESVSTGTPAETVYLSPEGVQVLAQGAANPAALDQIIEALPGIDRAAFDAAVANGTDLAIPMPTWLTDVVGTDFAEMLLPHVRLNPDQITAFERKRDVLKVRDAITEAAARAGTDEALPALERERQRVFDEMRARAVQAGRPAGEAEAFAQTYADFTVRTGARFALTTEEYRAMFPEAEIIGPGTAASMRASPANATRPLSDVLEAIRGADEGSLDPFERIVRSAIRDAGLDPATATDEQIMDALGVDARLLSQDAPVGDAVQVNGIGPEAAAALLEPQFTPQSFRLPDLERASPGPVQGVRDLASRYMQSIGLPIRHQATYVRVDEARAREIARLYDEAPDSPNDPETKAAYEALARETIAQYEALLELGFTFEWITGADPYATPADAIRDMQQNRHLWVFPTTSGFGTLTEASADNPLLRETDYVIDGRKALVNDLFRIVHDVFGHGSEGASFGPRGEENAWQAHVRMFTPLAARAMTSETRGQNSWVNFGPFGEQNRRDPKNTVFADQKSVLLPEWVSTVGQAEDRDMGLRLGQQQRTQSAAFRRWFGDSKVVDAEGQPLVVYHGTPGKGFEVFDPSRPGVTTFLGVPVEDNRQGFYFAEREGFAQGFADQRGRGRGTVMPVYLRITRPLDVTESLNSTVDALLAVGERAAEIDPSITNPRHFAELAGHDSFWQVLSDSEGGEAFVQAARDLGYDGIKMIEPDFETFDPAYVPDDTGAVTWVAFDASQIKSTANVGAFSRDDQNIYRQAAPPVAQTPGTVFREDRPQLPIREADGKVLLHHWSNGRHETIDPTKAGTGPYNSRERRAGKQVSFYGIAPRVSRDAPGTGYVKEAGLGHFRHIVAVDADRLYPYFEDPAGLRDDRERIQEPGGVRVRSYHIREDEYQRAIRDAGFAGYYVTEDGSGRAPLGNVAVLFEAMTPETVIDERAGVVLNQSAPAGSWYYSALTRAVETAKQSKAPAADWKAILPKLPGAKVDEIRWTGVNDWLDTRSGQVTREELAAFLRGQELEIVTTIGTTDGGQDAEDAGDITLVDSETVPFEFEFAPEGSHDVYVEDTIADWLADDLEDALDDVDGAREEYDADPTKFSDEVGEYLQRMIVHPRGARGVTQADNLGSAAAHEVAADNAATLYTLAGERAYEGDQEAYYDDPMTRRVYEIVLADGDTETVYVETDSTGYLYEGNHYTREEWLFEAIRNDYADRLEATDAEDPGVQFENYIERGDYTDYREVQLRVPNLHQIGPNVGRSVEPFVYSAHFKQENTVVHARLTTRRAGQQTVFFVEEIQSDLTSDWREHRASRSWWRTSPERAAALDAARKALADAQAQTAEAAKAVAALPADADPAERAKARAAQRRADRALAAAERQVRDHEIALAELEGVTDEQRAAADEAERELDMWAERVNEAHAENNAAQEALREANAAVGDDAMRRELTGETATEEQVAAERAAAEVLQAAQERAQAAWRTLEEVSRQWNAAGTRHVRLALAVQGGGVAPQGWRPDIPFTPFTDETTYAVMLKRLVNMAVAEGHDAIAWTPAYMQAERWSGQVQNVVQEVRWRAGGGVGVARTVELVGANGIDVLDLSSDGTILRADGRIREAEGMNFTDLGLGRALTDRILDEDGGTVETAGIIGGEGYVNAYDRTMRKFIEKWAKPYGGKVTAQQMPGVTLGYNDAHGAVNALPQEQVRALAERVDPAVTAREVARGADDIAQAEQNLRGAQARLAAAEERARDAGFIDNEPATWGVVEDQLNLEIGRAEVRLARAKQRHEEQLVGIAANGAARLAQSDPTAFAALVEDYPSLTPRPRLVHYIEITDAMREAARQPQPLFQPNRGQIILRPPGQAATIELFRSADPSTLMHEAGHHYLHILQQLNAQPVRAGEDPTAREDWTLINDWWRGNAVSLAAEATRLGTHVTSAEVVTYLDATTTGDGAKDSAIATALQEQWARAFERYIMEGKSPSIRLRSAFSRFRRWLTRLYSRAVALDVEITPEIRDVFDRMLAAPEEIAEAREQQGSGNLTEEQARELGMEEAAWQRMLRLQREAVDEQEERVLEKLMVPARRRTDPESKAVYKAAYDEAYAKLAATKEQRAREWLTNSQWIGDGQPVELPEGMRLNRRELADRYGTSIFNLLPRGKHGVHASDGLPIDEVAEWFGFASGDQLVQALTHTPRLRNAAAAEARAAVARMQADPLYHEDAAESMAVDALHGEKAGQLLVAELRALAASRGVKGKVTPRRAAEDAARREIRGLPVRAAMRSGLYLNAERRAANRATEALALGERQQAFDAKRLQLVNHMLYKASREVSEEIAKLERLAGRLKRKGTRQNLAPDYLGAIDEVLRANGLAPAAANAPTGALQAFIDRMIEEGRENELAITDDVIKRAQRTDYRDLSVAEALNVLDALTNLEFLARNEQRLLVAADKRNLDEVVAEITEAGAANLPQDRQRQVIAPTTNAEQRRRLAADYLNSVFTVGTLLRKVDGQQDNGPAVRNIKTPIDRATRWLTEQQLALTERLEALYGVYSTAEMRAMSVKRHDAEIGAAYSKWDIISIALNKGNADNWQRLTDPDSRGLTEAQADRLLETLDKRDWDFVQGMWNEINSFWPMIAERQKRLTGVAPRKVEAVPFVTKYGVYEGGYYPIKYDANMSAVVADESMSEIEANIRGGRYAKAQTAAGHLIERKAGSGGRPLALGMDVAHWHLNRVLHDLAYSEAVTSSWRILRDPRIRAMYERAGAMSDLRTAETWLLDVAAGQTMSGDPLSRVLRFTRTNFTLSKLAFNLRTVALQPFGFIQSSVAVGHRDMARGTIRYARAPREALAAVTALSPMMRTRELTFNKDARDILVNTRTGPLQGRYEAAQLFMARLGLALMQKTQFYLVDMPTWVAVYDRSRRAGMTETEAVDAADAAVIRAQAGGDFSDRSAIERGTLDQNNRQMEIVRTFTTLASYMFAKLNVAAERTNKARRVFREEGVSLRSATEALSLTADMLLLFLIESLVLAAALGELPDDEDDETWPGFLASTTAANVAGVFPIARDLASTFQGFDGGAYASILSGVSRPVNASVKLAEALFTDEEVTPAQWKQVANGIGLATGLPSTAVGRIIEGALTAGTGDEMSPLEWLMGRAR